jgi:hypothetical protein
MSLHDQIAASLVGLKGLASDVPKTIGWGAGSGPTIEVDFTAVDLLGCAFRELRVTADELKDVPFERVKTWADDLCRKVTYLLEHIAPLEVDAEAQTVLIRSTPPARKPAQTAFYEILVKAPGTLNLRRYTRAAGDPDRLPCDIRITNEVLVKLVGDLIDFPFSREAEPSAKA